jgi:plastocyanin
MKSNLLLLLCAAILVGCGKSDDKPQQRNNTGGTPPPVDEPVTETRTSVITGKIVFKGAAPTQRRINTSADPYCAEHHKDKPLVSEEVVVNDNGTLRNVFVYVKDGLGNRRFAAPRQAAVLDQVDCVYVPRVLGVQVGQPLEIRNSDDTLHNVHCAANVNTPFNEAQPLKGMKKSHLFSRSEVMVAFKCDVHPWMGAYVGVLPHPYFSVTGEDGEFSIKNLPAGEFTIEVWHEKYGTQTQKVKVGAGESQTIEFTFEAK